MAQVFLLTLLEVAFGMAFIQCFVPRAALGQGFGKTVSTIIFFCLLAPALLLGFLMPPSDGGDLVLLRAALLVSCGFWFAYFVAINYDHPPLHNGLASSATVAQLAGLVGVAGLLARDYLRMDGLDGETLGPSGDLRFASLLFGMLTSGLALGSVSMAMMIGHWYLVESSLSISWLKGACLVFLVSIALKAGAMAFSIYLGAAADPYGAQGFLDRTIYMQPQVFLTRAIVGIAIPAALGFMAWRAAAIRSTQSSTGILFPAQIVVFLAEMIGAYLVVGLGGLYI